MDTHTSPQQLLIQKFIENFNVIETNSMLFSIAMRDCIENPEFYRQTDAIEQLDELIRFMSKCLEVELEQKNIDLLKLLNAKASIMLAKSEMDPIKKAQKAKIITQAIQILQYQFSLLK